VPHAGGTYEPKPLHRIVGGLLATDAGWSTSYSERVSESLDPSSDGALDLVCALSAGTLEIGEDGTKVSSGSAAALIYMCLRLLHRLQRMATVPAIDYEEYGRTLTTD
jgi:hypothetical protein